MRQLSFLVFLLLVSAASAQGFMIEDFSDISDWQLTKNYGAIFQESTFNNTNLYILNSDNYGDMFQKSLDLFGEEIKYSVIQFPFYSNNSYSDIVVGIVDKGGNERCRASVTFGTEVGVWHLFNRTVIDFQDCADKYIMSIGTIFFLVNDYPTETYIGTVEILPTNFTGEGLLMDPGWISIHDTQISPQLTPRGRSISISCIIDSESFLDNATVRVSQGVYESSFIMEKVAGNFTSGLYRYIFDPLPDQPVGYYDATITAWDYGTNSTSEAAGSFYVNSTLKIEFQTDEQVYENLDIVNITGTAKDVNDNGVPGNIMVTLSSGDWNSSFPDGPFMTSFSTEFFANQTPSEWVNVTVHFDDGHGNTGNKTKSIYVSAPPEPDYMIAITSPLNGSSYFVGDVLQFEAILLENDNPIGLREMSAIVGGTPVQLQENDLVYSTAFQLTAPGETQISFIVPDAITNQTSIQVIDQPNPDPDPYPPAIPSGGSTPISVNLTYENGTQLTGANVSMGSPTTDFNMDEVGDGMYQGNYQSNDQDIGSWNFTITIDNRTTDSGIPMTVEINLLSLGALIFVVVVVLIVVRMAILRR